MTEPRESVEDLLELLWMAGEDGVDDLNRGNLPHALQCFIPQVTDEAGEHLQLTIDQAIAQTLIEEDANGRIQLSAVGRRHAELVVRRHRLTESLLAGVLDVSAHSVESTACHIEHMLNAEVTDAVCAFLGHPPVCPHGRPIPRSPCCLRDQTTLAPLIVPLTQLGVGESARVCFIHTQRDQYIQRLSQLGLVPGGTLKLRRLQPTIVVEVGGTELALDTQAGEEIFVRRHPAAEQTAPHHAGA